MSWRRTNSMQSLYEIHKAQYGHVICIDERWKTFKKSINHCLCRNHFSEWTDHWSWRRVSWWRHQVETFSALLAICAVNSPITGEFPTQRPVTRNFDVFFDLSLNKRLRKQSWGRWHETSSRPLWLWRHCNDNRNGPLHFIHPYRFCNQYYILVLLHLCSNPTASISPSIICLFVILNASHTSQGSANQ